MRLSKTTIEQLYFFVLCGTLVSLLINIKLNSIGIILLSLVWIADGFTKEKIRTFATHPFFIGCSLFFLSYVFSWLLSEDKHSAAFAIEKKLSLPLLPAILLSMPALSRTRLNQLFAVFISATIGLMILALATAFYRYSICFNPGVFFYHSLMAYFQVSAIPASLFCLLSLILIFQIPVSRLYRSLVCLFLILCLFLLSSKIFLFLLLLLAIAYLCSLKGIQYKIITLSGVIMLLLWVSLTRNPVKERFVELSQFNMKKVSALQYKPEDYFDGLSMRWVFARFSKEIILEQNAFLLGVGTGDAEQLLKQKIAHSGMYTGDKTRPSDIGYLEYGFHNQYTQVWVQMGMVGLCIYLVILFFAWRSALSASGKWFAAILAVFTIGCLTESWLEVQIGLVLFLLFSSLGIKQEISPKI